jgi:hypothetical protein
MVRSSILNTCIACLTSYVHYPQSMYLLQTEKIYWLQYPTIPYNTPIKGVYLH